MKFLIKDLIKVIAKKYKLELPEKVLDDLGNSDLDQIPLDFLEEVIDIVGPLVENSRDNNIEFGSKEEFYEVVPKEYLDEVNPIDEDGEKLMSMSELREAVRERGHKITPYNSNDKVDIAREKLKASYVLDDYPIMSGLESSWRNLEKDYEVIHREDHPSDNPLSSFEYYLDMGFYPPPEIMMVLGDAFRMYFAANGMISLDEVLFGEKHKKTSSLAYKKHRKFKYHFFEFHVNLSKRKIENADQSLETIMLKAIEDTDPMTMMMLGFDPEIDIDTFLRGYRRWKQDLKTGKYD